MAKGQYKKWLEPENLVLLQGWKRNGLTDEQIAHNVGINVRTLWKWKAKYSQIGQALKVGKEQANLIVEGKLFHKATHGSITAMIFWLKNNWRDKYNDSELSPEERKLAVARTKKLEADAQISEAKANLLKQANDVNDDKLVTIAKLIRGDDDDESE